MKPVQLFQRSLAVTILLAATMAHGEGCGCGGGANIRKILKIGFTII